MKSLLEKLLAWQLRRLLKRNQPTIIAVAGSVGKTSTKLAIAQVLSAQKKVCFQAGNYNVPLTVPLVFFEQQLPESLKRVDSWLRLLAMNELKIRKPFYYDVVVLELGIDKPGEMDALLSLITPDISVLTAISYEHMANFSSLNQVAGEELKIISKTKHKTWVCANSVNKKYLDKLDKVTWYGVNKGDYNLTCSSISKNGSEVELHAYGKQLLSAHVQLIGEHSLTAAAAAAAIAQEMGLSAKDIQKGLGMLKAFQGRMSLLNGDNDVVIIDDTYNSSPEAVLRALDTLYNLPASRRIAVLGSMNELGEFSEESHKSVGEYCSSKYLAEVITIGTEAQKYLAPAARKAGCEVASFENPYDAGNYVSKIVKKGDLILFKGSQNGVFAEEAVKPILKDPTDSKKLVRQSTFWMNKKTQQFGRVA